MTQLERTNLTLIQRVKNRLDEASWEEFALAYEGYIKSVLRRCGVVPQQLDDLSQEILLSLWKSMESFEYEPDKCKFRTWLFTVCKNKVFSHFRSQSKNTERQQVYDDQASQEAEVDKLIEREWQIYVAQKAFDKVKNQFKKHIIDIYLAFQNGQKAEDIATACDIAENTVYVYNKRVKAAMNREIILVMNELE